MTGRGPQNWSNIYDALSHIHRRELLRYLTRETVGPVQTESLARHLQSEGTDRESLDDALVELRHVHLPKLLDADLITWRRDDGVVVPTTFAREAPALLYEPAKTFERTVDSRQEGQL
ncbi:DUF7344 domain-containing protein [Halobaculum limi]|uniref:DUF7344 domain-containing protein n=1 Tax=Halobaculum limi TaxID=3031916 RepID=UPI002406C9CE|nr:ArsR family transcriptional regulator [Halobaculum sp. YSMS11]